MKTKKRRRFPAGKALILILSLSCLCTGCARIGSQKTNDGETEVISDYWDPGWKMMNEHLLEHPFVIAEILEIAEEPEELACADHRTCPVRLFTKIRCKFLFAYPTAGASWENLHEIYMTSESAESLAGVDRIFFMMQQLSFVRVDTHTKEIACGPYIDEDDVPLYLSFVEGKIRFTEETAPLFDFWGLNTMNSELRSRFDDPYHPATGEKPSVYQFEESMSAEEIEEFFAVWHAQFPPETQA